MNRYIIFSAVVSSLLYASGPTYKTSQNRSYFDGDDATYKKGVGASFVSLDAGDVVKDVRLNLLWKNDHKNSGRSDTWPEYSYSQAVEYCNKLEPKNTWRLPTRLEAKSIFSFEGGLPYVKSQFKDTVTFDYHEDINGYGSMKAIRFWSMTESSSDSSKAWPIDFYNGIDRSPVDKSEEYNVRCVSGDMNIKTSYTRSEGIVTDNVTKLMWQDDYDNNTSTQDDSVASHTWENAIGYCENLTDLGYDDWRLPNATELYFITDDTKTPAIDAVFKHIKSDIYWTSTTIELNSDYKVTVKFNDGGDSGAEKSEEHYVRCVRGGINVEGTIPSVVSYLLD
jgi:hypothetical protein